MQPKPATGQSRRDRAREQERAKIRAELEGEYSRQFERLKSEHGSQIATLTGRLEELSRVRRDSETQQPSEPRWLKHARGENRDVEKFGTELREEILEHARREIHAAVAQSRDSTVSPRTMRLLVAHENVADHPNGIKLVKSLFQQYSALDPDPDANFASIEKRAWADAEKTLAAARSGNQAQPQQFRAAPVFPNPHASAGGGNGRFSQPAAPQMELTPAEIAAVRFGKYPNMEAAWLARNNPDAYAEKYLSKKRK